MRNLIAQDRMNEKQSAHLKAAMEKSFPLLENQAKALKNPPVAGEELLTGLSNTLLSME